MQWHAYGDRQYTTSRYLLVRSASPSDSWALVFYRSVVSDMQHVRTRAVNADDNIDDDEMTTVVNVGVK